VCVWLLTFSSSVVSSNYSLLTNGRNITTFSGETSLCFIYIYIYIYIYIILKHNTFFPKVDGTTFAVSTALHPLRLCTDITNNIHTCKHSADPNKCTCRKNHTCVYKRVGRTFTVPASIDRPHWLLLIKRQVLLPIHSELCRYIRKEGNCVTSAANISTYIKIIITAGSLKWNSKRHIVIETKLE